MSADDGAGFTPVTLSELGGVRYLHLGTVWVQGAMRIAAPNAIVLDYVQRLMAALLWLDPDRLRGARAVQLGLGAGSVTRFTHRVLHMDTVAVEVNPMVIDVCRGWFRLPNPGPGLALIRAEAGAWLAAAEPGSTRLLHVDLYDRDAAAPVLDSLAFYRACRRLLVDGGVMAVNLFGRDASFERSAARIAQAFGPASVWRLRATREGNTVVVATRGTPLPDRPTLAARADLIESRWGRFGLPARKWLRMLQRWTPAGTHA